MLQRKVPVKIDEEGLPRVLMKMDIEGSEIDVILDIIFTGGLQYGNKIITEWHERLKKQQGRKQTHHILHSVAVVLSNYSKIIHKEKSLFDFSLIDLDDE